MSDIDWENPFRPEDFKGDLSLWAGESGQGFLNSDAAAEFANARFRELIQYCHAVWKLENGGDCWFETPRRRDFGNATHVALLLSPKEIK